METNNNQTVANLRFFSDAREQLTEVLRAYEAGTLSAEALFSILSAADTLGREAFEDFMLREIYKGPTSPDPKEFHREACDCRLCGQTAVGNTVLVQALA